MRDFNGRNVLALLAISLSFGYAQACAAGEDRRSTGPIATGATTTASSKPSRTERGVIADYDPDDDYNGQYNDGDNDDSRLPKDRDNDSDSAGKSHYDSDDRSVRAFGHAVDGAQLTRVATLVKRYFAVASQGDGATACSMIVPSIARSVAEDLGRTGGPRYARGSSCATVLSKVFEHYHRQIAAEAAQLEVTGVRLDGEAGIAILGFTSLSARQLRLEREGRIWRISALLDAELP